MPYAAPVIEGRLFWTEGVAVVVVEEIPDGQFFDLEGIRPRAEVLFRSQGVQPQWDDVQVLELKAVWRQGDTYFPLTDSVVRQPRAHVSLALDIKAMAK